MRNVSDSALQQLLDRRIRVRQAGSLESMLAFRNGCPSFGSDPSQSCESSMPEWRRNEITGGIYEATDTFLGMFGPS